MTASQDVALAAVGFFAVAPFLFVAVLQPQRSRTPGARTLAWGLAATVAFFGAVSSVLAVLILGADTGGVYRYQALIDALAEEKAALGARWWLVPVTTSLAAVGATAGLAAVIRPRVFQPRPTDPDALRRWVAGAPIEESSVDPDSSADQIRAVELGLALRDARSLYREAYGMGGGSRYSLAPARLLGWFASRLGEVRDATTVEQTRAPLGEMHAVVDLLHHGLSAGAILRDHLPQRPPFSD